MSTIEFSIIGSWQQMSKIQVKQAVRSLGSWFDSQMSMNMHAGRVYSKAFRILYKFLQIKFLSEETTKIVDTFLSLHIWIFVIRWFYYLPQFRYD